MNRQGKEKVIIKEIDRNRKRLKRERQTVKEAKRDWKRQKEMEKRWKDTFFGKERRIL
jgi:hypothetical protein